MHFAKWHGLGNDFVFVNCLEQSPEQLQQQAAQICDRHMGIGADGLILVLPSTVADYRMQIFNADGSEAQMCGNAVRCFSRYLQSHNLIKQQELSIETKAGIIYTVLLDDGLVKVNLGQPILKRRDIPLTGDGDANAVGILIPLQSTVAYEATCVSTGVPHCVVFVESFDDLDWKAVGREIESHYLFPEKTNVEFIKVLNRQEVEMKVWERGVGVTLACGTGASAAAVAGVLTKRLDRKVVVHLDGGDLVIEWDENTGVVFMTGAATEVFTGKISL